MAMQKEEWHALAQQIRVDSIRSSTAAGSGHPSSSMSAADLLAVLMSKYLHYDFSHPENPNNDHLIFSKGHASPLLYAVYKAAGAVSDEEMLTFRKFGSRLQGHPTPLIPWVDVATGSLGQGLPIGVGVALAGKFLDKLSYHVWVLLGDSEVAEGSIWEALDKAGHYKLNNLVAMLDMNRLGQRGETDLGWDSAAYAARARAFGCHTIEIDGHDVEAIDRAFAEAIQPRDQPTFIVAKTKKGRGVSFMEDHEGWHGKSLKPDEAEKAIAELKANGAAEGMVIQVPAPPKGEPIAFPTPQPVKFPVYDSSKKISTRKAYGDALQAVGDARADVVAMDAEVSNSTFAIEFGKAHPDRFFEMFIAEQQLVAAAVGMSVRHRVPFASTFAAFLARAYDFIRMAAISQANIRLCGSHAGCSIGADGPSQMALEDLAMMRAVHGSTVLYPSDGNCTAHLVSAMADQKGISYIRTTREDTAVLYAADDTFPIGGSKTIRKSEGDQVTVVAAGITVHEAIKACEDLQGVAVCLIDCYSIKPIDAATLQEAVRATGGKLLVVEDHWPEGGLGDAVVAALVQGGLTANLKYVHLAVRDMPGSGTPEELMDAAGINARHIADGVRKLVG